MSGKNKGRFTFEVRYFLISVGVAVLIAYALVIFLDIGFWPAFSVATTAMLLNGWIAKEEDEAAGESNGLASESSKRIWNTKRQKSDLS